MLRLPHRAHRTIEGKDKKGITGERICVAVQASSGRLVSHSEAGAGSGTPPGSAIKGSEGLRAQSVITKAIAEMIMSAQSRFFDNCNYHIQGLEGYHVTQSGHIWIDELEELVTQPGDWPYLFGDQGDQVIKIHMMEAAAFAWLTSEQRALVRASLPAVTPATDPRVMKLVEELQVSKHVISHLTRYREGELAPWAIHLNDVAGKEIFLISGAKAENYAVRLVEFARPPSKGGNGSALHSHSFDVAGERYYFYALGRGQWVYKTDLVSFTYYIDTNGLRKVRKQTLRTVDGKGKAVKRGNRGFKNQLRTSPGKVPGRRRD